MKTHQTIKSLREIKSVPTELGTYTSHPIVVQNKTILQRVRYGWNPGTVFNSRDLSRQYTVALDGSLRRSR